MFVIKVELWPGGDESKAEQIAEGRICNLRKHEPGSDLGSFHGYFDATAVPELGREPFSADELEPAYHTVANGYVDDYPRTLGSVWDLVATMLEAGGARHPHADKPTAGLTLADIPGGA